jgi:putative membrane protein
MKPDIKPHLPLILKGAAMGMAEVIPGVSGGTIAFITGIYERLLRAIKSVLSPGIYDAYKKGGPKQLWIHIDGPFLLFLSLGMIAGVVAGVFGISHLLETYPQLLWSFFFGLIIASSIFVGRQVSSWTVKEIVTLLVSTALALYYTMAAPSQGIDALWFVFICGAIAISALMLPGISGSFILVLLGMYGNILGAVKGLLMSQRLDYLITVLVFAAGCLLGLATFSRVLTWMFKHHHNITMAALTGFMIGSLNKIWPWRQAISWRTNSEGLQVPLLEVSVWPGTYENPMVEVSIALMMIGFSTVWIIEKLGQKK